MYKTSGHHIVFASVNFNPRYSQTGILRPPLPTLPEDPHQYHEMFTFYKCLRNHKTDIPRVHSHIPYSFSFRATIATSVTFAPVTFDFIFLPPSLCSFYLIRLGTNACDRQLTPQYIIIK